MIINDLLIAIVVVTDNDIAFAAILFWCSRKKYYAFASLIKVYSNLVDNSRFDSIRLILCFTFHVLLIGNDKVR